MKEVTFKLPEALAKGAINLFRLEDEVANYVMAICHSKGSIIVPILNKRAYVSADDPEVEDTIGNIVTKIIESKVFPDLAGCKVVFKTAPIHSMTIKSFVPTRGIRKYSDVNKILEDNGYTVSAATISTAYATRDYSELLKTDDLAKAIFEENKKELAAVGATFESLGLESKMAYESILKGECIGVIFAGPTGTGKSWAGRIIAAHMGAPYLTLQIDRGTTVDTLVGQFVPKTGETVKSEIAAELIKILRDEKTSVEDALKKAQELIKASGEQAKWEFIPGPLLKAFKEGWIIILEEVNYGDPGVLAKLNEFTDGTLRVTINGIPYKKHPNFLTLMTMNPGYAGTDPLNVALKNRFAKVNVPPLTKEQFCDRMVGYSKGMGHALPKAFFEKLFDFAGAIEALGNDTQYHEDVKFSIRNAQRLCKCILTKACSLDEFSAAIAIQYLNDLTMDNDNCDQVEKLKVTPSTVSQISQMYDLYDYADVEATTELCDLSELFSVTEKSDKDDSDELLDSDDLDGLLGGLKS